MRRSHDERGHRADAGAAHGAGAHHPHPQGRAGLTLQATVSHPRLRSRDCARAQALSAKSCSKAWRPMAACTCPSTTRRSTTPRSTKLARPAATPTWRSRCCRSTSTTFRAADLKAHLCARPTPQKSSARDEIVPLQPLDDGLCLEALSNGPTLAFKDMAMQLLGNLFEYELARRGEELNILGATSGDTGSAAEYAMRGKKGVRVFMTSPHGRMSPFQQAQMFSLQDANIHNIADRRRVRRLPGHRQGGVQRPGVQAPVQDRHRQLDQLGAPDGAGGVLLRRLLPGHAGRTTEKVSFTVPSGNFGNVCAGHVARMMGLPIDKLVVATNENDVLDEFFRTGVYRVRASADTHETSSPSMDISKASQFRALRVRPAGPRRRAHAALFDAELRARRPLRARRAERVRAYRRLRLRQRQEHPRRPPGHDPRHLAALRRR